MKRVLIAVMSLSLIVGSIALQRLTAGGGKEIVGEEHWVSSISSADGKPLKIYLWEKRRQDIGQKLMAGSGKVVLLAHGATISSRVAFDLQVPNKSDLTYSLMDYLAEQGFDAFSIDYQNYGRSNHHASGLSVTTQVAANDINAAVDHICSLRGVSKVHLLGWSWGSCTAGLFAMQHPEKVNRLVLYGPLVTRRPTDVPPTADFGIRSEEKLIEIFESEATDPGVAKAFAQEAMRWDPKSPNGVAMDFATRMPLTDPKQISAPTMIIMGGLDRSTSVTQADLPRYFADLHTADKQFIIVPGAGHALHLQKSRLRFFTEITKWFGF
jgi:pimeloyl-ACP methyl ester carboxylesterase